MSSPTLRTANRPEQQPCTACRPFIPFAFGGASLRSVRAAVVVVGSLVGGHLACAGISVFALQPGHYVFLLAFLPERTMAVLDVGKVEEEHQSAP